MRISDWSSDVCSSDLIKFADIGGQHRNRHWAAVAFGYDAADDGLEIMDVAVHLIAEIGLLFIIALDRLRFAAVEQPYRATCENAAIALQIGCPGSIGPFLRHDLGDTDRRSLELFDNQPKT